MEDETATHRVVSLTEQAASLTNLWSPRIVGQVNDQYVKVARIQGEFTWHQHDDEDEMFLLLQGNLTIQYPDHEVHLLPGDMHIVPRATQHNPVCQEECLIALIETVTTQHTGDVDSPLTRSIDEQLQ